jgi:hypothetical protein
VTGTLTLYADDALVTLRAGRRFDVLLCDMTSQDPRALYDEVRRIDPEQAARISAPSSGGASLALVTPGSRRNTAPTILAT